MTDTITPVALPGMRPLQDRVAAIVRLRDGAYTSQVADALQISTRQAYGALNRAANAGRLFRSSSLDGETFWMLPDSDDAR